MHDAHYSHCGDLRELAELLHLSDLWKARQRPKPKIELIVVWVRAQAYPGEN